MLVALADSHVTKTTYFKFQIHNMKEISKQKIFSHKSRYIKYYVRLTTHALKLAQKFDAKVKQQRRNE